MVNWTVPTSVNIDFFNLGVKAVDPTAPPDQLLVNVPLSRTNTTFQNLKPGREYLIAIRTAKRDAPGRPISYGPSVRLNALTKPLPVENLEVITVNTTSVTFAWTTDSTSTQDRFLVTYQADEGSKSQILPASNTSSSYNMTVTQLLSGYTYTVMVTAIRAIDTDTEESDVTNSTGHTVPLGIRNLTLTPESPDLRISWAPPASGKWDSYVVNFRPILRNPDSTFSERSTTENVPNVRITDVFPGEEYEVRVKVISNDLESEEVEGFVIINPLPPRDLQPVKEKTTTNSITLSWTYDPGTTVVYQWTFTISDGGTTKMEEVKAVDGQRQYSLDLKSLIPGKTYNVEAMSHVNESSSKPVSIEATAKPVINSILTPFTSTNSTIKITYTVKTEDIFDQIQFSLADESGVNPIIKAKDNALKEVEFTELQAGTKYTIQAVTVSQEEVSSPITLDMITVPNAVAVNLEADARSVKVILGTQQGRAAQYNITCTHLDSSSPCGQQMVPAGQQPTPFGDLTPFQNYGFTVVTLSEVLRGEAKKAMRTYEKKTAEAAPGPVLSLAARDLDLHTVELSWQPPVVLNGILRSYHIAYRGHEPSEPQSGHLEVISDIDKAAQSHTIENLNAGFEYTFTVLAVTVAEGDSAEIKITLKTAAPAFKSHLTADTSKPKAPDASEKLVTDSKISFDFTNPFSNDNGYIKYYTIVVSTDPTADDSSSTLKSWSDAQKDSSIKVYQALGECADFFTSGSSCGTSGGTRQKRAANDLSSRVFVVGDESAKNCEGKQFCNGPLAEDTEYYVKLRGYTASGFKDTAYSEKIRTAEGPSSSNGAMVIGIVVPILIIIVIAAVVGIIIYRRKRRPKRATKHVGLKATFEQSTMNKLSRPVKLSDFPSHVRKMAADSDFKYAEEYEDLKEVGRDQPCLAAEFPPNRPKNRFTNILPYDHSRVKLLPTDDEEGSDYINANYMPGYNSKREYIATQGPLPATRDDFWRMVWEQSTRNIVMLTRCQEKGREKSDHYWPTDSEPKFYGDLQVVILNETHMPDWTITEFKMSLGEQSRNIRHFHYRVWPDFGVPKDPTSLIRFVRTVRDKLIREGGPIITHCSAGVGRSGTFIVLDHLLQLIREKDEVDIFSLVYKLRKERVLMVQTEQQYKFIHECLLCVLEGREEDTTYANVGQVNVGFEDDEGINVEVS